MHNSPLLRRHSGFRHLWTNKHNSLPSTFGVGAASPRDTGSFYSCMISAYDQYIRLDRTPVIHAKFLQTAEGCWLASNDVQELIAAMENRRQPPRDDHQPLHPTPACNSSGVDDGMDSCSLFLHCIPLARTFGIGAASSRDTGSLARVRETTISESER